MDNGVVIIGEGNQGGHLDQVQMVLVAVLERSMVVRKAELATVRPTARIDLAGGSEEKGVVLATSNLDDVVAVKFLLAQSDDLLGKTDFSNR